MTEREAFEAWAKKAGWPHHFTSCNTKDPNAYSQESWEVWQAARAQPAQAVPVLTDEQIEALIVWEGDPNDPHYNRVKHGHAIEQAVRAKMGVAVPMTKRVHKSNGGGAVHPALLSTDEWFEFWNTNDNVDGESIFPEFLYLAQDIEQAVLTKVGIVGKEGGNV